MTSIDLRLSGARARAPSRVTFLPPPASRRSPTPSMPASAIAQAPPRPSAAARRASTRRMSRASTLSTSPRAASSAAPALVTPSGARLASRADPARTTVCSRACSRPLPEGNLAYVPGGVAQTRNAREGNARFRQEPNFLYLTGIVEPGTTRCSARARTRRTCWSRPGSRRRWTCGAALRCPGTSSVCATAPTSCTTTTSGTTALAAVDALEGQTVFVPTHQKEGRGARARRAA